MDKAAAAVASLFLLTGQFVAPAEAQTASTCHGKAATIVGTPGDDELDGTTGRDVIVGLEGDDIIRGREGDDLACGGRGADDIHGGPGDDLLFGGWRQDELRGGPGSDKLRGGGHSDLLMGGAGDDDLRNDSRDAGMRGGPGDDDMRGISVSFAEARAPVHVDLIEGTATGQGHDRIDVVVVRGTRFDDEILGSSREYEAFYGRGGDDLLDGRGGFDDLKGGSGDDIVLGGSGNDFIRGERQYSDTVIVGDDEYVGGPGRDLFDLGFTGIPTHVDLSQEMGFSEGLDVIREIEDLSGSFRTANRLIGDDKNNVISGGGEGDTLEGRGGNDTISGEFFATNDRLSGGEGDDTFYPKLGVGANVAYDGGPGTDLLDFRQQQTGPGFANVNLTLGTIDAEGETGTVTGIEHVTGTDGPDQLTGDAKANILDGGDGGADSIVGMDGDDVLIGGPGHDEGDGGAGIDTCIEIEEEMNCEEPQSSYGSRKLDRVSGSHDGGTPI